MTQEADDLLKKRLRCQQRTALRWLVLFSRVWKSPVDPSAEEAWNEEIARRIADLDSGKAKTVPWEEVRRRTLAKFRHEP